MNTCQDVTLMPASSSLVFLCVKGWQLWIQVVPESTILVRFQATTCCTVVLYSVLMINKDICVAMVQLWNLCFPFKKTYPVLKVHDRAKRSQKIQKNGKLFSLNETGQFSILDYVIVSSMFRVYVTYFY